MITLNTQQYLKEDLSIRSRYFTFFSLHRFFIVIFNQSLIYKEIFFEQSVF